VKLGMEPDVKTGVKEGSTPGVKTHVGSGVKGAKTIDLRTRQRATQIKCVVHFSDQRSNAITSL